MIPKKIHYFWFGRGKKSALEKECIARFGEFAPNCEIIEWNEDTFDVNNHPYTKKAYAEKKWAFVSDYARLKVLYDEGGIYLDTDMYLLKDITPLLSHNCFLGKEDDIYLNAAVIGAEKNNAFISACLKKYDLQENLETVPRIITSVYNDNVFDIKVYDKEYFYPYSQKTIQYFNPKKPPEVSYMVHMWNYSWGRPFLKFLKKIKIYYFLVGVMDLLGIKKILKKIVNLQ